RRFHGGRGISSRKQAAVFREQLGVLAAEEFHEVLFGAGLQVHNVGPEEAGAGLRGGRHRSLQLARRVRQPRQDGRHANTRLDAGVEDRKSTRLNSSHVSISYAVFCLKKKKST